MIPFTNCVYIFNWLNCWLVALSSFWFAASNPSRVMPTNAPCSAASTSLGAFGATCEAERKMVALQLCLDFLWFDIRYPSQNKKLRDTFENNYDQCLSSHWHHPVTKLCRCTFLVGNHCHKMVWVMGSFNTAGSLEKGLRLSRLLGQFVSLHDYLQEFLHKGQQKLSSIPL